LPRADRDIVVPDANHRPLLWTPRVWPGAVLVGGEIVGTWRRAEGDIMIKPWRRLTREERDALAAEAESLPLPGLQGRSSCTGMTEVGSPQNRKMQPAG
jgi:hypothetical protein